MATFYNNISDRADFVAICCGYNVDESRTANYSRVRTILNPWNPWVMNDDDFIDALAVLVMFSLRLDSCS
jgi:hypothetical protein